MLNTLLRSNRFCFDVELPYEAASHLFRIGNGNIFFDWKKEWFPQYLPKGFLAVSFSDNKSKMLGIHPFYFRIDLETILPQSCFISDKRKPKSIKDFQQLSAEDFESNEELHKVFLETAQKLYKAWLACDKEIKRQKELEKAKEASKKLKLIEKVLLDNSRLS